MARQGPGQNQNPNVNSGENDDFSLRETRPSLGGGRVPGNERFGTAFDLVEQMHYMYVKIVKAKNLPSKAVVGYTPSGSAFCALWSIVEKYIMDFEMTTLAGFMIISGADNYPSMLEKSMYDSWKSRMELYIENMENRRMILNLGLNVPLVWHTIVEENGLLLNVYAIVNHHKVSKEIWHRVKLLMQGTKLSLQEKECKLYDEFDKFSFVKGETLYQYYWRFAQLINNMNVINMSMRPVQVNTKFLNSLPPEWSKFVTDVKLARDLHTINFDQLYSYLEQHEAHENEPRLLRERYQDLTLFTRKASNDILL
ncbi:hypothetical protein Tco_1177406, partial [Tanacetum coccineum]